MNIMSYLTSPAFEEFADAPVGADQLAHNQSAPGTEVPSVAPTGTEAPADNLEIPEEVGPALVASADEAQAAAIVEDPGHSEAEQAAEQAIQENASVLEQADVAPAEDAGTAGAEGDVDDLAGADAPIEEGGDTTDDLGGGDDLGETSGDELGGDDLGTDGSDAGGELGDDAGSDGADDLGGDAGAEGGDDLGADAPLEEDGLGEVEAGDDVTEGGEDGLDDSAGGDAETGETETNADDLETEGSGEAGEEEAQGEEESTSEEGDSSAGEETETEAEGSTEGESEESGEEEGGSEDESDSDDEDGPDIDIPDVDTEADEDDADEAAEAADEAEAEDEELEEDIIDTTKSIDDLGKDEASVEHYIAVLSHGCQRKSYNVQTVALAQEKLQELSRKWGRHAPLIPSMEDYTAKNLDSYYTNSLESFGTFLKKIRHVRDKFLDDFAQKMNDKIHLKAVETQIAAINTACDVQINRMKDLKLEGKTSVGLPIAIRSSQGVIAGVTAELKYLGDVAGIFTHDRKFLEGMSTLLKAAIAEGDATKSTSTIQKALKLALPVKSYPASVFTESPLGGFIVDKTERKATGSMVEDMKTLGDRAIPNSSFDRLGSKGGDAKAELTKADLIKMLKLAKVLIGLSRGTAGSAGKALVDSLDAANRTKTDRGQSEKKTGDKESTASNDKAMNHMVSSFLDALWNSSDNYAGFQWHLIGIADALVSCVKKVKGAKA